MCGIVGFIGNINAKDVVIKGLERLEYRGYDSSGIAVLENDFNIYKDVGRVEELRKITNHINSHLRGLTDMNLWKNTTLNFSKK